MKDGRNSKYSRAMEKGVSESRQSRNSSHHASWWIKDSKGEHLCQMEIAELNNRKSFVE
jgi:hypothetical protein